MGKEKEQKDDFKSADEIDIAGGGTGHTSKDDEGDTKDNKSKVKDNKSKAEDEKSEVEQLREELAKERAEKDNYKKGLLSNKKKLKSLDSKKKEDDDESEWDEDSSKFQKETLEKSREVAKEAVYTSNSNTAIQKFVSKYPETDKKDVWKDIAATYNSRRGKDSVNDIVSDLEDAYLIVKKDKGELVDIEEVLKGEQRGITKAAKADLATAKSKGKSTEKSSKKDISKGAVAMAKNFKNDPKKVAEQDDIATATVEL